jgi:hypothetical protein
MFNGATISLSNVSKKSESPKSEISWQTTVGILQSAAASLLQTANCQLSLLLSASRPAARHWQHWRAGGPVGTDDFLNR